MSTKPRTFRLVGSCPDGIGIVSKVTSFIAEHNGSIRQANQYEDTTSGHFLMRYCFDASQFDGSTEQFSALFAPLASELRMDYRVVDEAEIQRVVILVSKFDHCLAALLNRWRSGDLRCEIPCVISNHDDLRSLVEWYGIPYHHVPVPKDPEGKEAAFLETARIIEEHRPDTTVLARYMQIFPPWLCEKYRHKVINIHHSFLPSFAGAKPYHQAAKRGVKLIGATCHYVTEELDAGPIIEQDVVRIRHSDSIEDLMRYGKDVESLVLTRGLRYHLEDRILVHNNKTILFS